jgi:hypothetical protein
MISESKYEYRTAKLKKRGPEWTRSLLRRTVPVRRGEEEIKKLTLRVFRFENLR